MGIYLVVLCHVKEISIIAELSGLHTDGCAGTGTLWSASYGAASELAAYGVVCLRSLWP